MADDVPVPGRPAAYWQLLRAQTRSQTTYRVSFVIDLVTSVSVVLLDVATVLVLFRVSGTLGDFDLSEGFVMVGLSSCAFATADVTVGNIERVRLYVRTGLMDAVLVRPLGSLAQLLVMDIPLRKLSRVAVSIAILLIAVSRVEIAWTPARVVLVVVAPLAGAVFFASIFVASASVAFWWIDSGEIANSVTYGGREFASYPITVYGPAFRRVFAYGLGFGFVSYYPALALLGRPDPLGLPGWVGWISPLVAVVAALVAGASWRTGVRHYRSTGS